VYVVSARNRLRVCRAHATRQLMPDHETARIQAENQVLRHERDTLAAMVRRASREVPPAFKKDLIADLESLLKTSPVAIKQP
jgi:hypothetical protein